MFAILTSRISMKYWFKNVADNIYIYPKSAPRNLILQTRTSDCNSAILKYYSFENYFLNPEIMSKLGVIESEDAFYEILYDKWREYLHRIKSGVHLIQMMGRDFTSPQDMKEHMEEIKTYMRGHNLFDIFYGRYKKEEKDLLKKYIEIAPRDEFSDILDAADSFIYFQSKTKQKDIQNETK